jgi:hypothetical protein
MAEKFHYNGLFEKIAIKKFRLVDVVWSSIQMVKTRWPAI